MPGLTLKEDLIVANGLELVPRMKAQGYAPEYVERRRRWIEEKTQCRLTHVGAHSISSEQMRGNIENPLGAVQMHWVWLVHCVLTG